MRVQGIDINPDRPRPPRPLPVGLYPRSRAPASPTRPRVWTVIVVPIVAVLFGILLTTLAATVVVAIAIASGERDPADAYGLQAEILDLVGTSWGVVLFAAPPQIAFGSAALIAAWLSREPLRQRLMLTRSRMSWRATACFMLTAVGPAGIPLLLAAAAGPTGGGLGGPLVELQKMILATGPFAAVIVIFCVALMPGVMEELLFRGYVFGRLRRRMAPVGAVFVTAGMFSLMHLHPLQMIGVFPLSVFAGFITLRTGSVIPAMLMHFVNNACLMIALRFGFSGGGLQTDAERGVAALAGLGLFAIAFVGLTYSIVLLALGPRKVRSAPRIVFDLPQPPEAFPRRRRPATVSPTTSPDPTPPDAPQSFDT